jgi:hypothetical protein
MGNVIQNVILSHVVYAFKFVMQRLYLHDNIIFIFFLSIFEALYNTTINSCYVFFFYKKKLKYYVNNMGITDSTAGKNVF